MDKQPFTSDSATVDRMATSSYNKVDPREAGPFCITKVQSLVVVIDENDVPNMISVQLVTAAPGSERNHRPLEPGHARQSNSL